MALPFEPEPVAEAVRVWVGAGVELWPAVPDDYDPRTGRRLAEPVLVRSRATGAASR